MDKNEYQNHHGNDEEIVSFNFYISDLMYAHGFRKRYNATKSLLNANPKAKPLSTGILIVSDELKEGNYAIQTSLFGSVNNIINTLAEVLIERLKAGAGSEKANREKVLSDFMGFFYDKAEAELFDDYEEDEESE